MIFRDMEYSVSLTKDISLVTIRNFSVGTQHLWELFSLLAEQNINIDMISHTPPYQDAVDVSFTASDEDVPAILKLLNRAQSVLPRHAVFLNAGNSKLTVAGAAMCETPGVAAHVFHLLASQSIPVKLITTSDADISLLMDASEGEFAQHILNE